MKPILKKLGKLLAGGFAAVAAIAGAYTAFVARPASLTAELTYDAQTYPQQLINRFAATSSKFEYKTLYEKIKSIGEGNLDHEKINAITNHIINTYLSTLEPFDGNPNKYRTILFISIENTSEKVAKDIVINLPGSALISVRDETGTLTSPDEPLRSIKINSISPSNQAKIWAYFPDDWNAVTAGEIRISHADGTADLHTTQNFSGLKAIVARNSKQILIGCGLLFLTTIASLFLLFSSSTAQPSPELPN